MFLQNIILKDFLLDNHPQNNNWFRSLFYYILESVLPQATKAGHRPQSSAISKVTLCRSSESGGECTPVLVATMPGGILRASRDSFGEAPLATGHVGVKRRAIQASWMVLGQPGARKIRLWKTSHPSSTICTAWERRLALEFSPGSDVWCVDLLTTGGCVGATCASALSGMSSAVALAVPAAPLSGSRSSNELCNFLAPLGTRCGRTRATDASSRKYSSCSTVGRGENDAMWSSSTPFFLLSVSTGSTVSATARGAWFRKCCRASCSASVSCLGQSQDWVGSMGSRAPCRVRAVDRLKMLSIYI